MNKPSVDAQLPPSVNSLASGKFEWNFRYLIFQIISVIDDGWGISCELALDECHSTLLMISQHWHQAITWANVDPDLCRQMASLGPNELTTTGSNQSWDSIEHQQKLIRPGESHNECTYQVWHQCNQQFVCKYAETAQPIRGQEAVGIQQSIHNFKVWSGECHKELTCQTWCQSNQWFVCKCMGIRGYGTAIITAWCRSGNKPLSEPMMVRSSTHICIIRS